MSIGIFDSGLGGLIIARAIEAHLPHYDYVYLGDTMRVPYGGRSREAIAQYTEECVDFLFREGCELVIIACNTASAAALRHLQQQYLPRHQPPHRRILGVIVPTLEEALATSHQRIGLLGTRHLVTEKIYEEELAKMNPAIKLYAKAAPLLVPMIELNGLPWIPPVLEHYLEPILCHDIESLILGCTHYPLLTEMIRTLIPAHVKILSQDKIIPPKLEDYLQRHADLAARIGQSGKRRFCVTDRTDSYTQMGQTLFGEALDFERVDVTPVKK